MSVKSETLHLHPHHLPKEPTEYEYGSRTLGVHPTVLRGKTSRCNQTCITGGRTRRHCLPRRGSGVGSGSGGPGGGGRSNGGGGECNRSSSGGRGGVAGG